MGLLDADGHIKWNPSCISKQIISWYCQSIIDLGFSSNFCMYSYPEKVWSRATVSKKKDVLELANLLNINNYPFIMERKWNSLRHQLTS